MQSVKREGLNTTVPITAHGFFLLLLLLLPLLLSRSLCSRSTLRVLITHSYRGYNCLCLCFVSLFLFFPELCFWLEEGEKGKIRVW